MDQKSIPSDEPTTIKESADLVIKSIQQGYRLTLYLENGTETHQTNNLELNNNLLNIEGKTTISEISEIQLSQNVTYIHI